MELREQIAKEAYDDFLSVIGLTSPTWAELAEDLKKVNLHDADVFLANPEISKALKLMDMIPEGKYCTPLDARNMSDDCPFVLTDQDACRFCGGLDDEMVGDTAFYLKHPGCPKPAKGENDD